MNETEVFYLRLEVDRLKKENAQLRARVEEVWGVVEAVATGEKLQCVTCGKNHPCECDK
jgi:hypothetical protein